MGRHGTIRGGALETQGKELKRLLTLVKGTVRLLDGYSYFMCIFQQWFLLACGFAPHSTVLYIKSMKNKLTAGVVLTYSPLISVPCIFFLSFMLLVLMHPFRVLSHFIPAGTPSDSLQSYFHVFCRPPQALPNVWLWISAPISISCWVKTL